MLSQLKKHLYQPLMILMIAVSLFSCKKNVDQVTPDPITPNNETPDLSSRVSSSISGFVTDENDAAVADASVQAGTGIPVITDSYGYFEVRNADVVKNAAMVTVTKTGYFKGIKTYIAVAGKSAFFRIKLIPKTNAGTISAAAGGNITLPNGLQISFPANAIVTAGNSVAYTGTVNAAVHWLDPTATDLAQTMPGDLRGINDAGGLRTLTTYGMAAIELTGASGELLQIASGKKATITMPVPAALAGTAPASMPLWYFDENVGLWKQEGTATKTGNTYVGEVAHFSFWNCDMPNNYIHFDCTVLDGAGNPIHYALVKVSVAGSPYSAGYGYTDSSGYVGGAIPNDAQLVLEVYSNYNCGLPVYSQNFSTTNVNLSLGNITITATSQFLASVSGTVTDCASSPVTNGYIIMLKDNQYYRQSISSSGSYDFNVLLCNSTSANVTLIAEDVAHGVQSTPMPYMINAGANVIGNFQACGVTADEYVHYTMNSVTFDYTSPVDSFYQYTNVQTNPPSLEISAQNYQTGTSSYVSFGFTENSISAGSIQQLTRFYPGQLSDSLSIPVPLNVNITEYGNVGEFIAGNFAGVLTGRPPANTAYNVSCNFRVRRVN